MINKKQIEESKLKKVTGGYAGYNKYRKNEYHDAGFITDWGIWVPDLCRLCGAGGKIYGGWVSCKYADKFVDYYKTHTLEDYIAFMRVEYNHHYEYCRGWDISE